MISNNMWTKLYSRILYRSLKNSNISGLQMKFLSSKPDTALTELPEYPPISEPIPAEKRKINEWYKKMRELPTIEEKLLESTKNPTHIKEADETQYADCRVIPKPTLEEPLTGYRLRGIPLSYGTLPAAQYLTRTKLIDGLPSDYYDDCQSFQNVEIFYQSLKPLLEEALITNNEIPVVPWWVKSVSKKQEEKIKSDRIINQIFRIICSQLNGEHSHLERCHVDRDARVESFWLFDGFPPTEELKKKRKEKRKEQQTKFDVRKVPYITCYKPPDEFNENENVEEIMYYSGHPCIQLRTESPLPPVVSINDTICNPDDVPKFRYVPEVCDLKPDTQWPVLLPGVWPGNPYEFGHTSFHTIEDLHDRRKNLMGTHGEENALKECGITSSFGWLMALAAFQGYGPYNELKLPLVCQTIVANAQRWSFYLYQMNTCHLAAPLENNKRSNICWASKDMKLYDEISNGQIKGLNDDVLKLIIKFLLKEPIDSVVMKEYVGKRVMGEADWVNTMEKLRARYSQRPCRRTRKPFDWERIYVHNNAYISFNPNRKRKHAVDDYVFK